MHRELVDEKRWISERRFLHALNYCMVLPGPEAQQLATYIGWLMHRTWGGIVAGALFVLPSLVVLIALSWLYMAYGNVPAVAGILYGIKPAVVAIVLHAAWRIGSRALKRPGAVGRSPRSRSSRSSRSPCRSRRSSLAAGVARLRRRARRAAAIRRRRRHTARRRTRTRPRSSTTTRRRRRTRASAGRGSRVVVAVFVALWAVRARRCWSRATAADRTLPQMGWFFTKAALLTFGGAYAVLPYVYQGAVETYGWLTPAQMIDGLALGETTPGPLIMVVAFVGFVGGWTQAAVRAGLAGAGGHRRRVRRDVLHVPAVVPVHPRRRAADRDDARPAAGSPRR